MIVLIIIGILVGFILTAAMDGVRRAEERSTQALIAKLDAGLNDRLEALLAQTVEPNNAHAYLGALWNTSNLPPNPKFAGLPALPSKTRAFTIAKIDYIKAEMPDVFLVQGKGDPLVVNFDYPFNFAAGLYPGNAALPAFTDHAGYMLPLGAGIVDDPTNLLGNGLSFGAATTSPPITTGIYGASYSAAAGLTKQLHAAALRQDPSLASTIQLPMTPNQGFDGIDNNNNGLIDELVENGKTIADSMVGKLLNHRHKTARSEMLYALLVEGQGPLGSVFSPDDFRDNEVKDTDGDGLLEFVDAWGEPLQFYRWPIFYSSDSQRGLRRYNNIIETRDQNPLDPNQELMNPAWWGNGFNANAPYSPSSMFGGAPLSNASGMFQGLFFTLTDPRAHPGLSPSQGLIWDRGPIAGGNAFYSRGAFSSRFLILSGGPDRTPGVPILDAQAMVALGEFSGTINATGTVIGTPVPFNDTVLRYLRVESQAGQFSPERSNDYFASVVTTDGFVGPLGEAAADDVSSQNLQAPGGATQ